MWLEPYKQKYRVIERYTDPLTGKTKRVSTIIDRDTKAQRKAAEELLRAKIQEATTRADFSDITLKELVEKYIEHQEKVLKASSIVSTKAHMKYLLDIFDPDTIVSRLTAGYVYERISTESSSPYMINRNILYFKAMINWAYAHDYVQEKTWIDKIQRVKIQKKADKVEECYLEPEELRKLIRAIPQYHWKLLTQFLVLSGLRIGEVMALKNEDVDTYIHVSKTYHSASMTLNSTPKTESSNRDVFIQPELAGVIRKIRIYKLRNGITNNIFFPMPDGAVLSYDAYQHRIKKYSKLSIDKAVTPHMLRHTHVSLLAEKGIPLDAISRRLGHHDSEITKEVYLHVTKKRKLQEEAMISKVKFL